MDTKYSSEKNIQILIALIKAHNIKRVVTSPGGTNMMLNASLMYDGHFEMYSAVDERSAAYIACGMAAESNEPVMLTCTGATASRNYYPGLTEAFYRKLPILVVTGTQDLRRLGNLYDQVIDRSQQPKDLVIFSTYIPTVRDDVDAKNAALRINQAISALTLNGGGPSHINLETCYSRDLSVTSLPDVKVIRRFTIDDELPAIPNGKIAIFVGAHKIFSNELTKIIDEFCYKHNSVVFCDHVSNYKGEYRQINALLKTKAAKCLKNIRLVIHIGEVSGDHFSMGFEGEEVWRVNNDGQLRDRFGKLTCMFNMSEKSFFEYYKDKNIQEGNDFITECKKEYDSLINSIPELPLSNIWMAQHLSKRLPLNCCIHFGILTSLRSWNFFEINKSISSACNVGGFGTDGMISSLLGASLVNPCRLYFGVVGDLAFFYDMNTLGNRHFGNNVRILLVNNGKGCEFTHHLNAGHIFKDDVNPYIAAAGHNGNQSSTLVRDFSRNLNFEYLSAKTKKEFLSHLDKFTNPQITKSCVFEVFTKDFDENEALRLITLKDEVTQLKDKMKEKIKGIVGVNMINCLKNK